MEEISSQDSDALAKWRFNDYFGFDEGYLVEYYIINGNLIDWKDNEMKKICFRFQWMFEKEKLFVICSKRSDQIDFARFEPVTRKWIKHVYRYGMYGAAFNFTDISAQIRGSRVLESVSATKPHSSIIYLPDYPELAVDLKAIVV